MLTEEERQSIIDAAVEKALLALPSVMGNLMAQQAVYSRLTSKFYKDYPDFAGHKDIVAACIEAVDGTFPNLPYEEKLKKAVPEIKKQIAMLGSVSMEVPRDRIDRRYEGPIEAKRISDHGEI